MTKRITAPFYTTKKTTLKGYLHGSSLADGCLYAKGKYPTKITAEDLPEHYIPGAIFKSDGSTEGYYLKSGDETLGGFFPMWLGEFYSYYQWYYNISSAEIIHRQRLR